MVAALGDGKDVILRKGPSSDGDKGAFTTSVSILEERKAKS